MTQPRVMAVPLNIRNFGDIVAVLDRHGKIIEEGRIVGRSYGREVHYDIEAYDGERINSVPASRVVEAEAVA